MKKYKVQFIYLCDCITEVSVEAKNKTEAIALAETLRNNFNSETTNYRNPKVKAVIDR